VIEVAIGSASVNGSLGRIKFTNGIDFAFAPEPTFGIGGPATPMIRSGGRGRLMQVRRPVYCDIEIMYKSPKQSGPLIFWRTLG